MTLVKSLCAQCNTFLLFRFFLDQDAFFLSFHLMMMMMKLSRGILSYLCFFLSKKERGGGEGSEGQGLMCRLECRQS